MDNDDLNSIGNVLISYGSEYGKYSEKKKERRRQHAFMHAWDSAFVHGRISGD